VSKTDVCCCTTIHVEVCDKMTYICEQFCTISCKSRAHAWVPECHSAHATDQVEHRNGQLVEKVGGEEEPHVSRNVEGGAHENDRLQQDKDTIYDCKQPLPVHIGNVLAQYAKHERHGDRRGDCGALLIDLTDLYPVSAYVDVDGRGEL